MSEGFPRSRRRSGDRGWRRLVRENWYRDVVLVLIIVMMGWSTSITIDASHHATTAIRQQREGRAIAVAATCSAVSAVIDAGRATIGASTALPRRFERNLERLGYPPRRVRVKRAQESARAYGSSIARRIERATGQKGLARKDGTLDCERLSRVSRVPPLQVSRR